MAYFHGVKASEVATSIVSPVNTTAGLPVVVGTAPVHLTKNPNAYVNKPVICYEYSEAVEYLGYSTDWSSFTLSEVMYSEFQLYCVAPIVFINVLDPTVHKTSVTDTTGRSVTEGVLEVTDPVLLSSLKVKGEASGTPGVIDTDYTAAYDDDGVLIISIIDSGAFVGKTELFLEYDKVDASKVTESDIIGGVSSTGAITGLAWLDYIYTLFSLVPGIVAAPGWSHKPSVASVMKAKALSINGLFRCIVLTDVDTTTVTTYSAVNAWKNTNNYTGVNQVVCWPKVKNSGAIFYMSTQLMGIIGSMDSSNDDVPYQSPSNLSMQATGICLANGTDVSLSLAQANMLNSQGVVTAINFSGGWKSWGNYTGCYPSDTDPKDCFICVRRMFDWQYQTFILSYWQKVDRPLLPRLIKTILDSEMIRLNGLVARGYLLGADIKFLDSENPLTDLMQGIIRVHSYITPPVPAQEIDCIFEYDTSNFETLFNS